MSLVNDALARPYRLIGLVQNQGYDEDGKSTGLYEIGCAGRITSFDEPNDEHNVISLTLSGTSRFRLFDYEEHKAGYRLARVSWDEFRSDLIPADAEIDRNYLISMMQKYFELKGYKLSGDETESWNRIKKYGNDRFVSILATLCPLEIREKQALLESHDLAARAELLAAILEMACYDKHDEQSTKH